MKFQKSMWPEFLIVIVSWCSGFEKVQVIQFQNKSVCNYDFCKLLLFCDCEWHVRVSEKSYHTHFWHHESHLLHVSAKPKLTSGMCKADALIKLFCFTKPHTYHLIFIMHQLRSSNPITISTSYAHKIKI